MKSGAKEPWCGEVDMTNMCMEVRVKLITNGRKISENHKKKLIITERLRMPTKETKEEENN